MVLESLFEGESVVKHPLSALLLGFVFSSVSMWIAFFSFPVSASILAISFITIAAVPMIHRVFLMEERKTLKHARNSSFLSRNFEIVKIYTWFSIGIIIAYAAWFLILTEEPSSFFFFLNKCILIPSQKAVFKEQTGALSTISAMAPAKENTTAKAAQIAESKNHEQDTGLQNTTAKATQNPNGVCGHSYWCWFDLIFSNNSSLMLLAVLLSFLFGAGALFLISWNASILGTLVGQNILARNHLAFLGLMPHGIPEFAGFFMGAISGGMISVALSQKQYCPKEFEIIAKDSFIMLLLALFSLFVGAAVESFTLVGQGINAMVVSVSYIIFMTALFFHTQL